MSDSSIHLFYSLFYSICRSRYEDTRSNPALFAVDYDRLFVETIGGVLREVRAGVRSCLVCAARERPRHTLPSSRTSRSCTHSHIYPRVCSRIPTNHQMAPSTPFVDSSPSNGMVSPGLAVKRWSNPQDPRHGDVHYYNYASDCQVRSDLRSR